MNRLPGTPNRTIRAHVLLLCCIALTITAIIAQTGWTIFQDRELTLAANSRDGLVAARLLQEHATQTLRDAERELTLLEHALLDTPPAAQNEAQVRQLIAQHLNDNQALTPLQFADLNGETTVTHPTYRAHTINLRQHAHIDYLLQHPDFRGTIIGHPFQSTYDSEWLLPLSRNLFSAAGNHLGLLSLEIRLNYFSAMYGRTAQNNDAIVALFDLKGEIIVRSPFEARYVKRDISAASAIRQIRLGPSEGWFEDNGTFDDERTRFYMYRKLSGYPLALVVGRDSATILQAWQDRSQQRALLAAATIVLILILSYLLLQHIRRLQASDVRLRQSQDKFMELFQHSPLPLALLDDTGRFVEANHMFLSEFGHADRSLLGQACLEDSDKPVEVVLRHRDGHDILCLLSIRTIELATHAMRIFAPLNIAQQRQNENESRELNQQLEQRVAQRTASLQQTNQQLEQALSALKATQADLLHAEKMAALGSLVAGVAHELNTPIGTSMTMSSTILDHTSDTLRLLRERKLGRSALESFLHHNEDGSKILLRNLLRAADLITSFKQVAVDQTADLRRDFDLRQTLEELLMTLTPLYAKTGFVLETDFQADVRCESYPGPLGQIITNFITNALKHGFDGRDKGRMQLSAHLADPETIKIVFKDDGIGMDEKHLARVFDPFFTTKLGQGGSGLGMHIVYNLATGILAGKIDIQSAPGAGTCLTLTLPRFAPQREE